MQRTSRSVLSVLLCLTAPAACIDDPEAHSCAADEVVYRSGATDLTERARLASFVDSQGTGGDPVLELDAIPDFRYGAVYVANSSSTSVWLKLEDDTGLTTGDEVEVPSCTVDPGACHLWLVVSADTTQVTLSYTTTSGGTLNTQFFPLDPDPNDDRKTDLPGNVVELNCSGIGRFYDEGEGGPYRNYVSVLDSREVVVENVSNPSEDQPPTYCVWTATKQATDPCPDWQAAETYAWTAVMKSETVQQKIAKDGTWTFNVDDAENAGVIALGFTKADTNKAGDLYCPAKAPSPELAERQVIRLADTESNLITFEYIGTDVDPDPENPDYTASLPIAVPVLGTVPEDGVVQFRNCSSDAVHIYRNDEMGGQEALDLAPMGDAQRTFGSEFCFGHWHFVLGDDPTMILKKKADPSSICADGG